MSHLRRVENWLTRLVRDPQAVRAGSRPPATWDLSVLRGAKYCLLTTFRDAVGTPVWFGIAAQRVYIRSGADDGKVKRIRRNPAVVLTRCTARGRPLGPPMEGTARVLPSAEQATAEQALRRNYGLERRLYGFLRAPWLRMVYIEVCPAPGHRRRES